MKPRPSVAPKRAFRMALWELITIIERTHHSAATPAEWDAMASRARGIRGDLELIRDSFTGQAGRRRGG